MNEGLFFIQIILIACFAWGALKLGKEALMAWISIQAIIANVFVLKQISLFGFEVTASDAFSVGSLLGLNLLQEFFSSEDAKKTTWICFFCMFFFTLASQIHLLFLPSTQDTTHTAFQTLLVQSPRLLAASMIVFFVVQQIDVRVLVLLKKRCSTTSFAMRSTISLVFSQFLDTVLFSFAGLYGMVASLTDVILVSLMVKGITIGSFWVLDLKKRIRIKIA